LDLLTKGSSELVIFESFRVCFSLLLKVRPTCDPSPHPFLKGMPSPLQSICSCTSFPPSGPLSFFTDLGLIALRVTERNRRTFSALPCSFPSFTSFLPWFRQDVPTPNVRFFLFSSGFFRSCNNPSKVVGGLFALRRIQPNSLFLGQGWDAPAHALSLWPSPPVLLTPVLPFAVFKAQSCAYRDRTCPVSPPRLLLSPFSQAWKPDQPFPKKPFPERYGFRPNPFPRLQSFFFCGHNFRHRTSEGCYPFPFVFSGSLLPPIYSALFRAILRTVLSLNKL